MARTSTNPTRSGPTAETNDWYQRWIDGIADDVAANMEGEPERQARIDDLHARLDEMRRRFRTLRAGQTGRGPHVNAGATPQSNEDARIQAEISQRLKDDLYIDASSMTIAVKDGHVTLTGTAESRILKRLAEDCADTVDGVRDVHNNLRIA